LHGDVKHWLTEPEKHPQQLNRLVRERLRTNDTTERLGVSQTETFADAPFFYFHNRRYTC